jgi:hypothetical protein
MSPTLPSIAAATARPTPKISVTVVPEARTAAASFFSKSRRWMSMRRRSVRNCSASTRRAAPAAPRGSAWSRIRAAWPAVMRLLTPPGTKSHSTACILWGSEIRFGCRVGT